MAEGNRANEVMWGTVMILKFVNKSGNISTLGTLPKVPNEFLEFYYLKTYIKEQEISWVLA